MPILRKKCFSNFTTYPNELLQSVDMTPEALGVLVKMLSFPQDWKINQKFFINEKCKRDRLSRIFNELRSLGYLHFIQERKSGRIKNNYWVVSSYCVKSEQIQKEICKNADLPDTVKSDPRESRFSAKQHLQKNNNIQKNNNNKKHISLASPSDDASKKQFFDEICLEFNQILGNCGFPNITQLSDTRRKHLKSRLKELPSIEDWRLFFEWVGKSDRITNEWCSFDWLIKSPTNMLKVIEGNYHSGKSFYEFKIGRKKHEMS